MTWANGFPGIPYAIITDGTIFIRTASHLWKIGKSPMSQNE